MVYFVLLHYFFACIQVHSTSKQSVITERGNYLDMDLIKEPLVRLRREKKWCCTKKCANWHSERELEYIWGDGWDAAYFPAAIGAWIKGSLKVVHKHLDYKSKNPGMGMHTNCWNITALSNMLTRLPAEINTRQIRTCSIWGCFPRKQWRLLLQSCDEAQPDMYSEISEFESVPAAKGCQT